MTEKAKAEKKVYMREWRRRNKDKVKAAQERYWENKASNNVAIEKEQTKI
ncbi:MAG: hypothetical protein K0R54_3512 [Clostridiaceae bacterium]|jgi:hypothetical protein|nr:hypothetical protein [Clostridiaceae bacterium]